MHSEMGPLRRNQTREL